MDFGDTNDNERGMAIFDYESNEVQFIDWEDCPKYMTVKLSDLQDDDSILESGARVKCVADTDITYTENSELKQKLINDYKLREFNIEETIAVTVSDGEITNEEAATESTSSLVRKFITKIESDDIENELLLDIYDEL
jgi:hypothetical protein